MMDPSSMELIGHHGGLAGARRHTGCNRHNYSDISTIFRCKTPRLQQGMRAGNNTDISLRVSGNADTVGPLRVVMIVGRCAASDRIQDPKAVFQKSHLQIFKLAGYGASTC